MATQDLNYTLDEKDKKGKNALATKAQIQEDYTRADVYYQTLNVRSIIQNEAYPVKLHIIWLLLNTADTCRRIQTHADTCRRMQTHADRPVST